MKKLVVTAVAVLLLQSIPRVQAQPPLPSKAEVAARVEALVRERLADPKGPASISVTIIRGGETLVQQAWGTADATSQRPAGAAMTYQIGSVTKQFTAALVLKLVDTGKLSLADALGQHLTGLRPEWQPLTIEQLLNHTSGLQREYRQHLSAEQRTQSIAAQTLMALAARDAMAFAPGTKWGYSNTGYLILAVLVEKLFGKPYADVVRDEIARPLGLKTLGWCSAPEKRETETKGHRRSAEGALVPDVYVNPDLAVGAGGLCASAGDLARWNQALHGGGVLKPASYADMITPRGAAVAEGHGFGLRVRPTPWGTTMIGFEGSTPGGFLSESAWFPADSLSVAVLYNSGATAGAAPIAQQLARIALGR